ncbi:uncharacterized protein N7503_009182 [Penicillium pulvis]|uniref:uncharacterized protein n=1 Tax=Penicillium pulvis TaxID=1562058 RepID=UPI002547EC88|nr:uncharacterized protein N7503_009182 [Penicillium pulvis]KAJ5793204.1 hypothetical protein N7503_009182 [Penicillium pulvis]
MSGDQYEPIILISVVGWYFARQSGPCQFGLYGVKRENGRFRPDKETSDGFRHVPQHRSVTMSD